MPIHVLQLLHRQEVAKGTLVFTFTKPTDLHFKPGQYAGFTLINPPETDAGGITRRFSLLSSPEDETLQIATRIQNSAYKRVLNNLAIGSEIKFAGPTGMFTLHDDPSTPAVFLAGGIGITPFYSMMKWKRKHPSSQSIYLFYGNQSLDDAAFATDFLTWQQQNPNFHFIPTLANPDATWQGERGFITDTMIKKTIPNISMPIYYICGSPAMVTALQETLVEMGVQEEKIKVEDFPGY